MNKRFSVMSVTDGFKRHIMMACGLLALGGVLPISASTNETTSFSPIFIKDSAGKLRTLTWTYAVNGGQPLTVEDEDAGTMTMKCGDLKVTVNPVAKTREGSFAVSLAGDASGSATAKFTESLEDLVDRVCIQKQQVNISMKLSAEGQTASILMNLLTQFSPSAEWFLDRSDLDQWGIGYASQDESQGDTTGSVKISFAGYGTETRNVSYSGPVSDEWSIVDVLDSYQAGGRLYHNVVVVERTTQAVTGDLSGSIDDAAVLTYWVAQGVGMIKGIGQYQFMGKPLQLELTSATLILPPLMLTQSVSFPAMQAKGVGDVFDPGAKASSKLPVTYESSNESVAIIREDGLVETVAAGTAVIWAHQEGNDSYRSATPVKQTLTVKARISADVEPELSGSVTGTGLCTSGQKATLIAKPASGYTFLRWEDDSQAPVRALVASEENASVTAYFGFTAAIELPTVENPGSQRAMVGVAFTIPLSVSSECLPTVSLTGLPAGLKYDANTRSVTGVPTKAGSFNVTVTASNPKGKAAPQSFSITVNPLPAWAQGTFDGVAHVSLFNPETETEFPGTASMSVTALGAVTGKLTCGGTNYAFTATSYAQTADGFDVLGFYADAKAGKMSIPLSVFVQSLAAAFDEYALTVSLGGADGFAEGTNATSEVHLRRNVWKDKGLAVVATNYTGYYTATLPGGEGYGSGYLAFTVDKVGGVKTAGKLADGTAVSLSGSLVMDEGGAVLVILYTAPTAYKGGCFFGIAEFVRSDDGAVLLRLKSADDSMLWENRSLQATSEYGAKFARSLGISGGRYNTLINLRNFYENGLSVGGVAMPPLAASVKYTDWNETQTSKITQTLTEYKDAVGISPEGLVLNVTPATGAGTGLSAPKADTPLKNTETGDYDYSVDTTKDDVSNTSGLTLTYTRTTGLFTGSFKTWYDYASAVDNTTGSQTMMHTSKTISFEGALTPVREEGDAEGRGFFLWADKSSFDSGKLDKYGNPILTPYSFNWSYDFLLRGN